MKIRFLGAARQVTGSCYHLSVNGMQFLVDCGMQQGENAENDHPFAFQPSEIACLFLTHAHIDHSGLIPKLVKDGFKGQIITTGATAELVKIMLHDSAHIQEKEAEWKTKKALRQGKDHLFEPLYTVEDVEAALPFFVEKTYGETGRLGKGLKYCFIDAGHILGSSTFAALVPGQPRGEEDRLLRRHRQQREPDHRGAASRDDRGLCGNGIDVRKPPAQRQRRRASTSWWRRSRSPSRGEAM